MNAKCFFLVGDHPNIIDINSKRFQSIFTKQELLDSGVQRETLSCCKRTEQEMLTFTGSADILLKRVERIAVGLESRESRRDDTSEFRFREQREHFEKILKNYSSKFFG